MSATSLAASSRVAADRPGQQVAEHARAGLARDGVARHTATATGRKIGSTIASAAAGYSEPLDSTADSSVGPWPGGGARWVTATNTATSTGSPHSSARLTQVRGRRASLTSSTLITQAHPLGPGWPSTRSAPELVTASTRSSSERRSGCISLTRSPPRPAAG